MFKGFFNTHGPVPCQALEGYLQVTGRKGNKYPPVILQVSFGAWKDTLLL